MPLCRIPERNAQIRNREHRDRRSTTARTRHADEPKRVVTCKVRRLLKCVVCHNIKRSLETQRLGGLKRVQTEKVEMEVLLAIPQDIRREVITRDDPPACRSQSTGKRGLSAPELQQLGRLELLPREIQPLRAGFPRILSFAWLRAIVYIEVRPEISLEVEGSEPVLKSSLGSRLRA